MCALQKASSDILLVIHSYVSQNETVIIKMNNVILNALIYYQEFIIERRVLNSPILY